MEKEKVVIVGGGFAGIAAAKELENNPNIEITLITNSLHFEYYPALYRILSGLSPAGVCLPYDTIFHNRNVEIVNDKIIDWDYENKKLIGESGSVYHFNYAILAFGTETVYFNVEGMSKFSYSFKSINEALRIKNHLHQIFRDSASGTLEDEKSALDIVVVGAGATGVEVAADMAIYAKELAKNHGLDFGLANIILYEAGPRIFGQAPEFFSKKVQERLLSLGVKIFTNAKIEKQEGDNLFVNGEVIKTKTVIWTAGQKSSSIYEKLGFKLNKKGKVEVNEFLEALEYNDVFVAGDGADTKYSGFAQTAILDGKFIGKHITNLIKGNDLAQYKSKPNGIAIPVGIGWAGIVQGNFKLFGYTAFIIRRLIDFKYFLSILKPWDAINTALLGNQVCEVCLTCIPEEK